MAAAAAADASQPGSSLLITVEPTQSSFFAGEAFTCRITFANTLPAWDEPSPRIGSSASLVPATPPAPSPSTPGPRHGHSRSLDVRGFALQHQLTQHDDSKEGGDELYYRSARAAGTHSAGSHTPSGSISAGYGEQSFQDAMAAWKLPEGQAMPTTKGLIGPGAAKQGSQSQVSQRHNAKAASVSVIDSARSGAQRAKLGLGRPGYWAGQHDMAQLHPSGMSYGPGGSRSHAASAQHIDALPVSPVPTRAGSSRFPSAASSIVAPLLPGVIGGSSRKPSAPLPSSHPHSRKKSVAQVQAEDLSAAFELGGNDAETASTNGSATAPSQASTRRSLYSLGGSGPSSSHVSTSYEPPITADPTPRASIDSRIGGGAQGGGPTLYGLGQNDTMESVLREDFNEWSRAASGYPRPGPPSRQSSYASQRSMSIAIGSAAPASPMYPPPKEKPGTEKLIWSFAQFSGHFEIDESLIKPADFEEVKRRIAFGDGRAAIGGGASPAIGIGGGEWGTAMHEMDEKSGGAGEMDGDGKGGRRKSGWGSYLRGALWDRSDGGSGSSTSSTSGRLRLGSTLPGRVAGLGRSHRRSASTLVETREKTMASRSVPIYSTPPSVLAVDLDLAPGESRSYIFSVPLPPDLPPSYSGRSISFTYVLTLGTNRMARLPAGNGRPPTTTQKSRLIRIPLRVYNHVSVSGVTAFYDLTNPIVLQKETASVTEDKDEVGVVAASADEGTPRSGVERPGFARTTSSRSTKKKASRVNSFGGLLKPETKRSHVEAYARELLASCRPRDEEDELDAPTDLERAEEALRLERELSRSPSLEPTRSISPEREKLAPPPIGRHLSSGGGSNGSVVGQANGGAPNGLRSPSLGRPSSPLARQASFAGSVHSPPSERRRRSSVGSNAGAPRIAKAGGKGGASIGLGVDEDEGPKSSMEAVELLSRNSQKVSYDILKDGQVAATLTLIKSKYRLGDSVAGVVSFNRSGAIARVVRFAATLETHEEIQSTMSTLAPNRVHKLTRKVHASAHENCLDEGQAAFTLPIPNGATPDFVTSGVKLCWTVRLSFLTLSSVKPALPPGTSQALPHAPLPPHLAPSATSDGFGLYHETLEALPALSGPLSAHFPPLEVQPSNGGGALKLPVETKLEVVECAVPLNVLPHTTRLRPGGVEVYA